MSKDRLFNEPYMAFIDGSLHYDCTKCKDNCCNGLGTGGMEDGPIGSLIDNNSALLPWVQSRNRGYISISTPKSGCWFLQNDGRCKLELDYGRSAKPGVCLSFPFNRLSIIGDRIVVRPNFLCSQLEFVVPPRPGYTTGSHAAVIEDLHTTGILHRPLPVIAEYFGEDVNMILAREGEFRDASAKALGCRTVTDLLADYSQNSNKLFDFRNRALKVLGFNSSETSNAKSYYNDMLLVMLPSIRFDYLHLTPEGCLRTLLLAESLIHFGFAGLGAPKITDLFFFLDVIKPLLKVLSFEDEPYKPLKDWNPDSLQPLLDGIDHKVAFGKMIILTGKGYGTIQSLEEALAFMTRPLERLLFIRRLADLFNDQNSIPVKEEGRKKESLVSDGFRAVKVQEVEKREEFQ